MMLAEYSFSNVIGERKGRKYFREHIELPHFKPGTCTTCILVVTQRKLPEFDAGEMIGLIKIAENNETGRVTPKFFNNLSAGKIFAAASSLLALP
jgi:hypothetical protein